MFSHLTDSAQKIIISILIFLIVFGIYLSSRDVIPVSDSRWAVYIALSVAREGNTDLDEYAEVIASHDNYAVVAVDDHLRSFFPLGAPLMVVPMMFVADKLAEPLFGLNLHEHMSLVRDKVASNLELAGGASIAALAAVAMYWVARLYLDRRRSLIIVFIFALATSMYSTASRALWQHGPSVLMLLITLYLVLAAKEKPRLIQFAGLPLAFAYIIRPTNSLSVIFISLYVLIAYRRYFIKYILWASLIAIPFLLSNYAIYDTIVAPYYLPQRLALNSATFLEALAGNMISPARGLLIYSPIFLFSAAGVAIKIKKAQFGLLDGLLLCILFCHWLIISSFPHWYGGFSYGPRFFTDMLPYLMYFLIPVVAELRLPGKMVDLPFAILFLLLLIFSLFTHFRGSNHFSAAIEWNGGFAHVVDDLDKAPERVWDWSDPQFLRGLRPAHLSVKQPYPYLNLKQDTKSIVTLMIANRGDQDFTFDVQASPRIDWTPADDQEKAPLPRMSARELTFTVDTNGLGEGVHNLGGIFLSADSAGIGSVKNSPLVLSVAVELLPKFEVNLSQYSEQLFLPIVSSDQGLQNQYSPPPDILVDGRQPMSGPDQIQAVFGAGWYDLEQLDPYGWRWARSPAVIYVYSPTRQKVAIESTAVSLLDNRTPPALGAQGVLRFTMNDDKTADLAVQINQPFVLETELQRGWNVLTLELEAGNFIPAESDPATGDARELSFSLDKINIIWGD